MRVGLFADYKLLIYAATDNPFLLYLIIVEHSNSSVLDAQSSELRCYL